MGPHGKASLSAERPRGHYSKASLIILERLQQLGGMPEDWTQGTTGQSASPPSGAMSIHETLTLTQITPTLPKRPPLIPGMWTVS